MADFQQFREQAKQRYQFASWPAPAAAIVRPPRRFVSDPATLAGYVHERRRAFPDQRDAWIDYYRRADDGEERFAVTIREYASVAAAREALLDMLALSMAPLLPRAEEKGIILGEIAFAGHGDIQTRLWFVRDNVLVEVSSTGSKQASVGDLAMQIDRQLQNRPRL